MRLFLRTLTLTCVCAAVPALAQYSLDKVVFSGAAPYNDAELLAVAGIQPGQFAAQDSLKNAAQHLLDSGLFDDLQVDRAVAGKMLTVHFNLKPKPPAGLLAVSLENLVWFTPEELAQGIHQRVPLYHGAISDAGNMADLIQAALEQMLAAKGVKATLTHSVVEPTNQHPMRVVDYKVEQPAPRVTALEATIVSQSPEALADAKVTLPKNGMSYNEGLTGLTIEDFLLRPARSAGYVAAKVEDLHRELTGTGVSVTAKIVPGEPFKVASVAWEPTPVYTAADFARDAKLHPGDTPALFALNQITAAIQNAYLRQGDMDAYVVTHAVLDAAAHTVAYSFEAVPGETYHLHAVIVNGLSPAARQAFDAAWTMKPGDLYSDLAVGVFLRKNIAQEAFKLYGVGFQAIADPSTHLVDLTFTFTPNGSR
jgi:outer membrane protein assembly factor BamA